jgi:hypothetical protein
MQSPEEMYPSTPQPPPSLASERGGGGPAYAPERGKGGSAGGGPPPDPDPDWRARWYPRDDQREVIRNATRHKLLNGWYLRVEGPFVAWAYHHEGTTYVMLGEVHSKIEDFPRCWTGNLETNVNDGGPSPLFPADEGIGVLGLLDDLFTYWEEEGVVADFYLEQPYLGDGKAKFVYHRLKDQLVFQAINDLVTSHVEARLERASGRPGPWDARERAQILGRGAVRYHICDVRLPMLERRPPPPPGAAETWEKARERTGPSPKLYAEILERLYPGLDENTWNKHREELHGSGVALGTPFSMCEIFSDMYGYLERMGATENAKRFEVAMCNSYADFCLAKALPIYQLFLEVHQDAEAAFRDLAKGFLTYATTAIHAKLHYLKERTNVAAGAEEEEEEEGPDPEFPEEPFRPPPEQLATLSAFLRTTMAYRWFSEEHLPALVRMLTHEKGKKRDDGAPPTCHRAGKQVNSLSEDLRRNLKAFLYGEVAAMAGRAVVRKGRVRWDPLVRDDPALAIRALTEVTFDDMVGVEQFVFDAYLLGRALYYSRRRFAERIESGQTSLNDAAPPQVAVIYAGAAHCTTAKRFFDTFLEGATLLGASSKASEYLYDSSYPPSTGPLWTEYYERVLGEEYLVSRKGDPKRVPAVSIVGRSVGSFVCTIARTAVASRFV